MTLRILILGVLFCFAASSSIASPWFLFPKESAEGDTNAAAPALPFFLLDKNKYDDFTPQDDPTVSIRYELQPYNEYLTTLRDRFALGSVVEGAQTETEKALRILHWVHGQWSHDGMAVPKRSNAIAILEEAREGKNFRCVEYAVVTTACLNALGMKARTILLYTKNVETTLQAAGHVATEVYLEDFGKWAFLDPEWDAMPFLKGVPLNAVEFQNAIAEQYSLLEMRSGSHVDKGSYTAWILPYLYYMDVALDNTQTGRDTNFDEKGVTRLMLVPLGAKQPKVFQVFFKIDNCTYTHSLKQFYGKP